jgi:hypothetical protein
LQLHIPRLELRPAKPGLRRGLAARGAWVQIPRSLRRSARFGEWLRDEDVTPLLAPSRCHRETMFPYASFFLEAHMPRLELRPAKPGLRRGLAARGAWVQIPCLRR